MHSTLTEYIFLLHIYSNGNYVLIQLLTIDVQLYGYETVTSKISVFNDYWNVNSSTYRENDAQLIPLSHAGD